MLKRNSLSKFLYFIHQTIWWWLLLLLIPPVISLLVPGFFGASDDLHVGWLFEMDRALKAGQFPPRFVPDLSYGFGYPLFNFVFPLPFYIGELFHLIGFSLVDSIKWVFGLSLIGSGLVMFLLLRKLTHNLLSLAGALIYVYTPYRSTDVYVRGALGESLAFIFFPLIILSILQLTDQHQTSRWRWLGIGSLSIGGLVLSHNISAYMFIPFAVLLAGLRFWLTSQEKRDALANLFALFVGGLLTSAYFWLPALLESSLVKYDTVFNFSDHFPTIKQLLVPYWGYGASVPGPGDGMSFYIGTVNLLLVGAAVALLIVHWQRYSRQSRVFILWCLVSFLAAFVMMNYRSSALWKVIPLMPYFQFPWRFLIVTTFASSALVVALETIRAKELIALVLAATVCLLNSYVFHPHDFLGRMDKYYLNRYIPSPTASNEYRQTQEEYLRLPVTTLQRPDKLYPYVYQNNGQVIPTEIKSSLDFRFVTGFKEQTLFNVSKYWYPGWVVLVDQQPVFASAGQPFGQINFSVPAGTHQVRVHFSELPWKLIIDLLSLLAILIAIVWTLPLSLFQANVSEKMKDR